MMFEISELECYRFYKSEGMFESISRTVTCTGELSALIRVIPRGKRSHTPLSRLSYLVLYTLS